MAGRPFSVNNPFRHASNDSSIKQYQGDQQYQDWLRGQNMGQDDARSGGSEYGRYSVGSFSPPPPGRANTNPFLDDAVYGSPPIPQGNNNSKTNKHLSADEEKDQLRKKYSRETANAEMTRDLPPAYEEVTRPRKGYPKEKESYNASGTVHRSGGGRRTGSGEEYARGEHLSRRHHSHRHHKDASPSRKEKRKGKVVIPKNVDTIDKLDVTGLFGGSFHHDGPFDAVTPHRNKNTKAAPVLAFPADGPNSTIGGVTTKKSAMNEVFGVEEEDDDADLYNIRDRSIGSTASVNTKDAIRGNVGDIKQVDVKSKTERVHGPTTYGLGSTTFLDGAPASQAAIRDDIRTHSHSNRSGIQRHKSLSQRLGIAGEGNRNNGYRSNGLSRTRSGPTDDGHDRYRSSTNAGDEEDIYLGLPQSSLKKSSGSKFMKRVRSLKVGRK